LSTQQKQRPPAGYPRRWPLRTFFCPRGLRRGR